LISRRPNGPARNAQTTTRRRDFFQFADVAAPDILSNHVAFLLNNYLYEAVSGICSRRLDKTIVIAYSSRGKS